MHNNYRLRETQHDSSRVSQQYTNLVAGASICRSVESLYGPHRALKAIQFRDDDTRQPAGSAIVSDALHVVDGLQIDSTPVGYVLREALHGHYTAHGTGELSDASEFVRA